MLKPQVIAIPIFALLIAIEAFLVIRQNRSDFNRKDLWTNILIGFVSVGFGILFALFTSIGYVWAYEITPLKMPMNMWWAWVLLVLVDDFAYYWFHRNQ